MNEALIYIIIGLITLVLGLFAGMYIQKLKTKSNESIWVDRNQKAESQISELKEELDNIREAKSNLEIKLAREEANAVNLEDKLNEQKLEVEKLQEKFTKEFENLANKILEEKSEKFTKSNKENIENILTPLNKKIKEFEEKVEQSQKENISIHSALKEQLITLQSQNLKITQEAENLTKALKGDSKMQGNWGELVLERVLEKSGLEKDREYSVQQSFQREDGSRVMPDVIINLPDGKKWLWIPRFPSPITSGTPMLRRTINPNS